MNRTDSSRFPATHWSAVAQAANGSDPILARRAFEQLCCQYRDAIVEWMRLQRLSPQDSEDAAHDFLQQWLKRDNPLKGFSRGDRRFREFLRVCLRRFLSDWRDHKAAKFRGGGLIHEPLDAYDVAFCEEQARENLDYVLARQIHERVMTRLGIEWRGKLPVQSFNRLMGIASGSVHNPGYSSLSKELRVPIGTIKSWVFRLRGDYYDSFREAVMELVDPLVVDSELVYLHELIFTPPHGSS